jgi:mannitol-1-phosphate/altronate dehydrogenase
MTNPYLQDRVDRIIRDPRRKLGWEDRLVGTMRLAIDNKIEPRHYTLGAALAVELLINEGPSKSVEECLLTSWGNKIAHNESSLIFSRIVDGLRELESADPSNILEATPSFWKDQ